MQKASFEAKRRFLDFHVRKLGVKQWSQSSGRKEKDKRYVFECNKQAFFQTRKQDKCKNLMLWIDRLLQFKAEVDDQIADKSQI